MSKRKRSATQTEEEIMIIGSFKAAKEDDGEIDPAPRGAGVSTTLVHLGAAEKKVTVSKEPSQVRHKSSTTVRSEGGTRG